MITQEGASTPAATGDPVALWTARVAGARAIAMQYEQRLAAAQATLQQFGNTPPPERRPMTGRTFPWQDEPNPDYDAYTAAERLVKNLSAVKAGTASKDVLASGDAKAYQDALNDLEDAQTKLTTAKQQAATTAAKQQPDIRTVNGIPMERGADGVYRPVRVGGYDPTGAPSAGVTGATATTTAGKGPGTVTKFEKGPEGDFYSVTYTVDQYGNEAWDGKKPVKVDLGESPGAALDLQTKQLNLDVARQKLAEATSPEAQQKARLELQTAQFDLDRARQQLTQGQQPTVITPGSESPVIVTRNPVTGAIETQPNPAYQRPPSTVIGGATGRTLLSRDPTTGALTTQRNPIYEAPLPQNAIAAYTQERARVQQAGSAEIARLQRLQEQGALSADDAGSQFQQWLADQTTGLTGLQSAAEEAQRQEQIAFDTAQRTEQQRVEAINRSREQYAFGVGQEARQQLAAVLPQVRTPAFLQGYGGLVSSMAARAAAPSAEAAAQLPAPAPISADTFNPANFRAAMPDLDAFARQQTARALSSISPAAAMQINRPMPTFPQPLDIAGMVGRVPYAGPLSAAPTYAGAMPTAGMNPAQELGTGFARTPYGPGGQTWVDWRIPG